MSERAHTVDSFEALRAHPFKWVGSQLTSYALWAILAGASFVLATGVFTLINGVPVADNPPVPIKKVLPVTPQVPAADSDALISRYQGKEIGVLVYFKSMRENPVGIVTGVKEDRQGNGKFLIVQPLKDNPKAEELPPIKVPYSAIRWHTDEHGTREWAFNNERVRASVKSLWIELDGSGTQPVSPESR